MKIQNAKDLGLYIINNVRDFKSGLLSKDELNNNINFILKRVSSSLDNKHDTEIEKGINVKYVADVYNAYVEKKNTFCHFRCFSDIVGIYIIDGKIIGKLMLKENDTNRFYYYGIGDSMQTTRDLKNIYIYTDFDCDIDSYSGHVYNIINRKEYKLEIETRWSNKCKLFESGD